MSLLLNLKTPKSNLLLFMVMYISAQITLALKACVIKEGLKRVDMKGGPNDLYIGTCQYMGENLMCVRNQPIQPLDTSIKSTKPDHSHEDTQR
ncbi:MAG: hypothetical protein ABJH28_07120 [Paraglaciecola sp.]|uniref:hypothetical protein n=1 Tax=Paraglaciecola sp. TaxID=1920173 RepID=UPI003266355D